MRSSAEISYLTLPESLQDVFLRQRTGSLTVTVGDRREVFLCLAGQLYLSGGNPGRQRLENILERPAAAEEDVRFDPAAYLASGLRDVLDELVETLASWKVSDIRFIDHLGEVPDDIVGPVPTAGLIMDLYSRGWSAEELLQRIGGSGARFRAVEDPRRLSRVPEADAEEVALFERLTGGAAFETLVSEGREVPALVCQLVRLIAVGLVSKDSEAAKRTPRISREVLEQISRRVEDDLEHRPLEVDSRTHRREVDKLLKEYGSVGFYDLLGVDTGVTAEEVHAAFMLRARRAHPVHATALGLARSMRKMEWLFGRLTEAYMVLSDPARTAEYRRGGGSAAKRQTDGPDDEARQSERSRLARESYMAALDYVEQEDYFYAIELLQRAVQSEPLAEYWVLLGRCQKQNPKWLHMAVDSLRQAIALTPEDNELREELNRVVDRYHLYKEHVAKQKEKAAKKQVRSADDIRARRISERLRDLD